MNVGSLLLQLINIYVDIVILDIILSWVIMALPQVRFLFTVKRFLDRLVEPALFPIRRTLRPYTRDMPLDFSPVVLILGLSVVQAIIGRIFYG